MIIETMQELWRCQEQGESVQYRDYGGNRWRDSENMIVNKRGYELQTMIRDGRLRTKPGTVEVVLFWKDWDNKTPIGKPYAVELVEESPKTHGGWSETYTIPLDGE